MATENPWHFLDAFPLKHPLPDDFPLPRLITRPGFLPYIPAQIP
jgi:hypothetical protein